MEVLGRSSLYPECQSGFSRRSYQSSLATKALHQRGVVGDVPAIPPYLLLLILFYWPQRALTVLSVDDHLAILFYFCIACCVAIPVCITTVTVWLPAVLLYYLIPVQRSTPLSPGLVIPDLQMLLNSGVGQWPPPTDPSSTARLLAFSSLLRQVDA